MGKFKVEKAGLGDEVSVRSLSKRLLRAVTRNGPAATVTGYTGSRLTTANPHGRAVSKVELRKVGCRTLSISWMIKTGPPTWEMDK